MADSQLPRKESRREILKKATYVAPAVWTLTASPAFAQRGSRNSASEPRERLVSSELRPPIVARPIQRLPRRHE
jgi:hypothetical protein